jgi:hypothetical protein
MHYICPRISLPVLIALTVLVISQPSSATTLSLDVTTLKGVTQIGSVTMSQVGKDVKVAITLDSGYLLPTHDSYVMFNTDSGLKLTKTSLDGFSVSKMSDRLTHVTTIGGFTFTDVFRINAGNSHPKPEHSSLRQHHDRNDQVADNDDGGFKAKAAHFHHDRDRDRENRILLSGLTFTILNANVNQFTGFGLQFCVADDGRCGKIGFAETSSVAVAPEPGTLALIGTGLVGLATMVRRSSGKKKSVS